MYVCMTQHTVGRRFALPVCCVEAPPVLLLAQSINATRAQRTHQPNQAIGTLSIAQQMGSDARFAL